MLTSIKVKTFAAATAFLAFAGPLLAQPSAPAGSALERALTKRIADGMHDIRPLGALQPPSGIARVVFQVGPDGRTHDVRISKQSGSRLIDREAVRLVSKFHDLPESSDGKNVYAVLQYGVTGEDASSGRYLRDLDKEVQLAHLESSKDVMMASAGAPKGASLTAVAYAGSPDRVR